MTLKRKCDKCGKESTAASEGRELFITWPGGILFWECPICGSRNFPGVFTAKCEKCGEEATVVPAGKQVLIAWNEERGEGRFAWNCPNPKCQNVNFVHVVRVREKWV